MVRNRLDNDDVIVSLPSPKMSINKNKYKCKNNIKVKQKIKGTFCNRNTPKTLGAQVHKKSAVRGGVPQSLATRTTENLKIQFQKNLQIILSTTKILKTNRLCYKKNLAKMCLIARFPKKIIWV